MEETAGERISAWFHRVWRRRVMRSGLGTALVLAILAAGFIWAYRLHLQGNFHKLKERMAVEHAQVQEPQPGGQEPLVLSRTRMLEDSVPEFLSVTMLPGRGMNVLQIRAYVPDTGEVNLLASPSLEDAAAAMTGQGADANGRTSLAMGGAFTLPWAGRIWETERGISLPEGISLPAEGGLMLDTASTSADTVTLPDGGQAEATFRGFGDHWPSKTEIKTTALLSSHTVDFTVTAHNTGDVAEPMGIGWRPRFAILNGAGPRVRLRIPGESRVEKSGGAPTGKLVTVAGTPFDYRSQEGATLPDHALDETFTELQEGVLDNGPVAELTDPANGYRLRVTALSPEIKAMRVIVAADGSYVSIGPQFNYPDPLGHEWKSGGAGIVMLQPGQSVTWKIRMEILPVNHSQSAM